VVISPSAASDESGGDLDRFAGPRSVVGGPLARAVCEVVGRRAGSDPQVGVASHEADVR
jgi:hypothetical protein